MQKITKRYEETKAVQVTTTDSFQGQENQIIFFVCVAGNRASPFVGDRNRICVALSRHVGSLFVIGNESTKIRYGSGVPRYGWSNQRGNGGIMGEEIEAFTPMVEWFKRNGRVADYSRLSKGCW